jgi:small basic protein (TIGR04137 family)
LAINSEQVARVFEKFLRWISVAAHFRCNSCNFLASSMSQHRSLKGASTIAARRNVLKRFERVELLKKRGQWKKDSKVIGLPKTKPDV